MDLTVIIVNFNVRYYLEQCLSSVAKAIQTIEAEVFVVDNDSVDGSIKMVVEKFPWVKVIANKENVGFSRANNQALEQAQGRYSVLLNPDTVVAEDTFSKVVQFMDGHPDAGGLGVRMVDGKGHFLPESKRGLPTPMVAFYKIIGLSLLFPKSRTFAKYHLGHLPEKEVNEVEVLSGACMFLRNSALEKVGLLDNNFFMYGEDIDLSYRISLGGYKNYYFPEVELIHYKGESTKKSSFNYVYVFYNAMAIFATKHFTQKGAGLFTTLINMAIYASAGTALFARTLRRFILPIVDTFMVFSGAVLIGHYLNGSEANGAGNWQAINFICLAIWITSISLFGGYDKPIKLWNIAKGTLAGSLLIAVLVPLLQKIGELSFTFLFIATGWTILALTLSRILLHLLKVEGSSITASNKKRFLVIGAPDEAKRVSDLIWQINYGVGHISTLDPKTDPDDPYKNLKERIEESRIGSIVFCAANVSDKDIIDLIQRDKRFRLEYKIARPGCEYLIGSNSIESLNDLFILDLNSVRLPKNRRNKRILDLLLSTFLLLTLPISMWAVKNKGSFINNIFKVFRGKMTWIGYRGGTGNGIQDLPKLRRSVLDPRFSIEPEHQNPAIVRRCNIIYAKDYSIWNDLKLVFGHFSKLGRYRSNH